jgi:two-component system, OmpR family, phosphate regulon sensor histidine kinase PhoR
MKLNRNYFFISVATIALIVVLIIQVNWIFGTARIKEEIFSEKANMVLTKAAEAISSDTETCNSLGACLEVDDTKEISAKLGRIEARKIDSILHYYMRQYNLNLNYSFKVIKPTANTESNIYPQQSTTYKKSLEEVVSEKGLELKLIFPDKTQFVLAEMGVMFMSSVVIIILVLILLWRTIISLLNEKKIAEHATDFLNNMTHEFKTPLTNIGLAGKMILKDSNVCDAEKVKHYSRIILSENEKLKLQVEQVLSIAAFERGEIPLQKTRLDFHELISSALNSMNVQIENRCGNVKLNLEAGNFLLIGDKMHLTNAICNLIDNAIKYSKEQPELIIQTANNNQDIMISISDNGIGIEKAYQDKVFEKFFRVPTGDIHNVKGFGLGLTYVRKIIILHNGTIVLTSEKGKGTMFTIILPYA